MKIYKFHTTGINVNEKLYNLFSISSTFLFNYFPIFKHVLPPLFSKPLTNSYYLI